MSAITTSSGCTCPSHQESGWGASDARQEKVIVEFVRNRIVGGRCFFFEERARVYGNGCVSECLYNAILLRRFWTVEKGRDLQYPRKGHQAPGVRVTRSQPRELLKPGRKRLLCRLLERPFTVVGKCWSMC